jgi:hypothetical protein
MERATRSTSTAVIPERECQRANPESSPDEIFFVLDSGSPLRGVRNDDRMC